MPNYTFINENDEEHIVELRMSELDEYKKQNPKLKQKMTINVIGGRSTDSGRLPEGFKDNLREMQKKHPTANGIKHLI